MARRLKLECNIEEVTTDFLDERLYVARTLVPVGYESFFRKRAQYRSVQTSTAIEGNELGDEQAILILVDEVQPTSPDEIEVKNLDEAYDLIQQIVGDRSVRIDEGLVRTMNSIILRGLPDAKAQARGKYRVGPSLIVHSQTRAVRYRPPPPEWVPELMEGLLADIQKWIRDETYPGAVIAAMAHFGLISIHPFEDGNGRTARLLADMILLQTHSSNEGMLSVSEAIFNRQQDYYDSLRETQGENYRPEVDVTPFVRFHMRVLEHAAINLESAAARFKQGLDLFTERTKDMFNARQARAFMFMLDVAPLSTSAYSELTAASQSAALSDLSQLVQRGYVERVGQGRSTRYRVDPEFRQLMEQAEAKAAVESATQ